MAYLSCLDRRTFLKKAALATTARRFHSASETVSANPSRSDF